MEGSASGIHVQMAREFIASDLAEASLETAARRPAIPVMGDLFWRFLSSTSAGGRQELVFVLAFLPVLAIYAKTAIAEFMCQAADFHLMAASHSATLMPLMQPVPIRV